MSNPKYVVVKVRASNGKVTAAYEYEVREDARNFIEEREKAVGLTYKYQYLELAPGPIVRKKS